MPRRAWNAKDEREFEHIRDRKLDDGTRLRKRRRSRRAW